MEAILSTHFPPSVCIYTIHSYLLLIVKFENGIVVFIYVSCRTIVTDMFLNEPWRTCPSPVVYRWCARWVRYMLFTYRRWRVSLHSFPREGGGHLARALSCAQMVSTPLPVIRVGITCAVGLCGGRWRPPCVWYSCPQVEAILLSRFAYAQMVSTKQSCTQPIVLRYERVCPYFVNTIFLTVVIPSWEESLAGTAVNL